MIPPGCEVVESIRMKYRLEPYDLTNPDDFRELLVHVTAEYIDMFYAQTMIAIGDMILRHMHVFYPFAGLELDGGKEKKELIKAQKKIEKALEPVNALVEKAEHRCRTVWQLALQDESDGIDQILEGLGLVARPSNWEMAQLLEFRFVTGESVKRLHYDDYEKTTKAFVAAMNDHLDFMRRMATLRIMLYSV